MCGDGDESEKQNRGYIFPMEVQHVFDEVYHGRGHDDEKDEQWQHREKFVEDGVEEIAEGDLKHSHPFGSLEAVFFVEGEVLVCPEDVDADG